jgi:hypothetical protein
MQNLYRRNRRRRSSKVIPKGMQNLHRKINGEHRKINGEEGSKVVPNGMQSLCVSVWACGCVSCFYSGVMGVFFTFLYNFMRYLSATIHPDIIIEFSTHQGCFSCRILRIIYGEGSFGLGYGFNMVASHLLQDG